VLDVAQLPRIFTDYRAALVMAVQEEIAGEAYFARLAEIHSGRASEALRLLAKVEAATATAMRPLVERRRLDLADTATLRSAGRAEADRDGAAPWSEFVRGMVENYPAFTAEFEQMLALAPAEDRALCGVLVDHEVAAVDFARLEAAGDPASFAPLEAFLVRHGGVG
jgi:hypothetical protein